MPGSSYVLLYDDERSLGLRPLSWTRPAFELRTGIFNLRERAQLVFGERVRARVRPLHAALLAYSHPELTQELPQEASVLLLDARTQLSLPGLEQLLATRPRVGVGHTAVNSGRDWRYGWIDGRQANRILGGEEVEFAHYEEAEDLPARFEAPWQLIGANGRDLCDDFRALEDGRGIARTLFGLHWESDAPERAHLEDAEYGGASRAIVYPGVHLLEERNIRFGAGARVKPGVVLDAEDGPIVLGAGCRIESNVTIQGPSYVGPGTVVHPMTRLREGSSIGAFCKLGGEIEEAVVLDLSNKQHDGFLGHAYLGSWVNLGADTNASDLKNNYGTVRVDLGEGPQDTGERFVGPLLADHVRSGINTMFTTGTVAGVCCNVFGGGFPPAFLASFSWGGAERVEYELEKALETARVVHARRRVRFEAPHEALLRAIHRETAGERQRG